MTFAATVVTLSVLLVLYTYAGYPLLVRLLGWARDRDPLPLDPEPESWPRVSFSVPVYNEEKEIRGLLDSILAIDYPAGKLEVVVVSDASTDGTDAIVREYADRRVRLVRLPRRTGKTAAEAAAAREISGDLVINTDASIRIAPDALRPLVARFMDPEVGLVSGRDVSISRAEGGGGSGEASYVGYEMALRDAETRLYGIVGASGCFYGIRRHLHTLPLPASLSRDFAAALHTEEHGYRAVSAPDALCYVPRTGSIRQEYRRKVRTIERGMRTLWHKRHLLNPVARPVFAWMLFSHKICRWLIPWATLAALLALAVLALREPLARIVLAGAVLTIAAGALGWLVARSRPVPRPLALLAFGLMGNVAAARALIGALQGERHALWEPTRRQGTAG